MMLVSAETMESPVTTVYSTAPNAAAAMVPMAYSIDKNYTASAALATPRVADGAHRLPRCQD